MMLMSSLDDDDDDVVDANEVVEFLRLLRCVLLASSPTLFLVV